MNSAVTGRPVAQIALIAGQHGADTALIEFAHVLVQPVEALDQRLVEAVKRRLSVKRAAAFVAPSARDCGQARRGVHRRRTVAMARETVAHAHIGALGRTVETREFADRRGRNAAHAFGPFGRFVGDMGFERFGAARIARHVIAVGEAFGEQHMHDAQRQGGVGARLYHQMQIGLLCRAGAIGVDDDQLGAARFPRARNMRHHVDLGGDGIAAPHDDQIGFRDLARVHAALDARTRQPARIGQRDADRRILARVTHDVAQAVDAVALHMAHRAGVEIRPHGFGSVFRRRRFQLRGGFVERFVPRDRREAFRPATFGANAAQRYRQTAGMMLAFGVARHLGADHAGRVVVGGGPAHLADPRLGEFLDLQRANAGAIMRTNRGMPVFREGA